MEDVIEVLADAVVESTLSISGMIVDGLSTGLFLSDNESNNKSNEKLIITNTDSFNSIEEKIEQLLHFCYKKLGYNNQIILSTDKDFFNLKNDFNYGLISDYHYREKLKLIKNQLENILNQK